MHFRKADREVRAAVPLSSPQSPLAQLQFSGGCRCFLARVWPVAKRKLRRTQDVPHGLFPLHVYPQLCCKVSLGGDVLWAANFYI